MSRKLIAHRFIVAALLAPTLLLGYVQTASAANDVIDIDNGYGGTDRVHIFRNTGTYEFAAPEGVTEVEYLVVGGGGAGGSGSDNDVKGTGGGGAGGLRTGTLRVTPGTAYGIEVGAGGPASATASDSQGESGSESAFAGIIAAGGGGGGKAGAVGSDGGSGGGGGGRNNTAGGSGNQPMVSPAQGSNGKRTMFNDTAGMAAGGGGGGAGDAAGHGINDGVGGVGGQGLSSWITGTLSWYAGGGAGGDSLSGSSAGGLGGGGAAGGTAGANGVAGAANTGGGGGGVHRNGIGGAGGSGIVVVRYTLPAETQSGAARVQIADIPTVTSPDPAHVPITLSGFESATHLVAIVSLSDDGGTLTITDTAGLTLEVGYGGFADQQTIGFRGTRAAVESALANLVEWHAPLIAVQPTLSVTVTEYVAGTFFNPDNGHYYKPVVPGADRTWDEVRIAAAQESLFGMTGYLATITSRQENEFIANYVDGENIWIGATDDVAAINTACADTVYAGQTAAEGRWYWVTGPEACTQFWRGNAAGSPLAGRFARWAAAEPNNNASNEHYAGTNYNNQPGLWNDFSNGNVSIDNYLIEFGGVAGEESTAAQASASRTLLASDQIVVDPVTVAPNTTDVPITITLPTPITSSVNDLIAVVSVPAGGGTLTVGTTTGLSLAHGYDGFSDQTSIGFHGARANVVAALGSVAWNAPAAAARIALSVSVSEHVDGYFYNPVNGHYYKPADNGGVIYWTDARNAASNPAYNAPLFGMTGYLATITSAQENEFVANYTTASNIWIGAADSRDAINLACGESRYSGQDDGSTPAEGRWYWLTGPEACTQFWQGAVDGQVVGGQFSGWKTGEPNDYEHCPGGVCVREHYAATNYNGLLGEWNDFINQAGLTKYLVEFGGMPNEASTALQAGGSGALSAATVPEAPTQVVAEAGDTQATVSWTAGHDNFSAITGYSVVAVEDSSKSCTATPPETSCTVTGLSNGTEYTFIVTAANAFGVGVPSAASNPVTPSSVPTYSLSGSVSGLAGSGLVLHNNGGDALSIGADGAFIFEPDYPEGSSYAVTVANDPVGQSCGVTNGSGTLSGQVSDVEVVCALDGGVDTYTIGGSVSGLASGGLVLQLNGGHALAVSANGRFVFSPAFTDGSSYVVGVSSQPVGQNCTLSNASGTLSAPVSDVAVSCATESGVTTHTLGGTVSGLAASGLVLHNNGGDALNVNADGAFSFAPAYVAGNTYAITIASQPVGQSCTLSNASGTLSAPVSDVAVSCTTNGGVATHSVGGTVSGLAGSGLVLRLNGGYALSVPAAGAFTFTPALTEGSSYGVSIASQPVGQSCTLSNATGTLTAPVSDVAVSCTTDGGVATHSVGGTVSGLAGSGLVLHLNGGYALSVPAAGAFTFTPALTEGSTYAVSIASQPVGQSCTLSNATGTLTAPVSDVAVNCTTDGGVATHSVGGTVGGLAGSGLVLHLNGGYALSVPAVGAFTFTPALTEGSTYAVSIASQPVGQSCTLSNASGTLSAPVSDVAVSCTTESGVTTHTLGGTVSGLAASGLVLHNNGGDALNINADGAFSFAPAYVAGSTYAITIASQPVGQSCTLSNANGTLSAPVSDVAVSCTTDGGVATHSVGGTVSGLAGSGLVLHLNGGYALSVHADGAFTFAIALTHGSSYSVSIGAQPVGQLCTVSGAGGSLTNDASEVDVRCKTDVSVATYTIGGTVSGLVGPGLALALNGGYRLDVTLAGPFVFPRPFTDGSAWAVTVIEQPQEPPQTCSVTHSAGILSGANVTDVRVECVTHAYVVAANASNGGRVEPASRGVAHGQTASFEAMAEAGYIALHDTGGDCPPGGWSEDTYTTGPITEDCTLEMAFGRVQLTGAPPAGGGSIDVSLGDGSDGGTGSGQWVFDEARTNGFVAVSGDPDSPSSAPPPGIEFPYGLFDFVLHLGIEGTDAHVVITYPHELPQDMQYWKYSRRSESWYPMPPERYTIQGNRITLVLTDGEIGDDDGSANRIIEDPGGPALPLAAVPTLSYAYTLLLVLALNGLGVFWLSRRQPRLLRSEQ